MMGNIYLLEKTLEREITERRAAQERHMQLRELHAGAANARNCSAECHRVVVRRRGWRESDSRVCSREPSSQLRRCRQP